MKPAAVFFASVFCTCHAYGQTGVAVPELAHCDVMVDQLLTDYDIPGASFAISRAGKLIYARGFGTMDLAQSESTTPHHLMRIASVSKPVTSIAIMKMIEDGDLALSDKVFGSTGIFAGNSYFNNATITDSRVYDITVQHLLEHSGGWDRDQACVASEPTPYPWTINHCDPIAFPLHVTGTLGEANPVSERAMVKFLLQRGLNFAPGTDYAYSNIGYLTLGLIIEEVSGLSYENYLKTKILTPVGIQDMHLGKNLLSDKREREAEYVGNGYTAPSVYGSGQYLPWEYGGWSIEAMDAHGGWIATTRDLVRLLGAVDNFNTAPDILSASSIASMTTPGANNSYYAKGWSVNSANNWWHTGSLDGTRSEWVRASAGFNWAIVLNKRQSGTLGDNLRTAVDQLPWNCLNQASGFPDHDLFDVPAANSTALTVSPAGSNALSVNWTSGDGDRRLLIAAKATPVTAFPIDGSSYSASATFGNGEQLNNGEYVVYNNTGNNVIVSGLDSGATYHFKLIDYNSNANGGNQPLYQPANYASGSGTVSATALCNNKTVTVDISLGQVPTNGDDVILGTSGDDVINALAGHDTICAGDGDDIINGGWGSDWVDGGDGDDTIDGAGNSDYLKGGNGIDTISGGHKSDRIYGDSGNDVLDGGDYSDLIYGGTGEDLIYGGAGNDRLFGQGGADEIHGEDGNDKLYGGGNNDELYGDDGDDRIWGETGHDKIFGGSGDDSFLSGGDHNDIVYGNSGNDIIRGGDGRDRVYGQGGDDDVRAQSGDDWVTDGGTGTDSCQVAPGNDVPAINCE